MSIVFFGTPEFAVPSLNALLNKGEEVSLVVTQPDRPAGRGRIMFPSPVKTAAINAGLNVAQPHNLKQHSIVEQISSLSPDFIIIVAYGKILPAAILRIPAGGCINLHASLLPKYRGAAPIQWAIINGDKTTGVTTMLVDEGLDTGDILLRQEVLVEEDDTSETLSKRLSVTGASLIIKTITGLREKTLKPLPQTGEPSYARIIKKEDGLIDWSREAREIFDFARGMHPWPGAYFYMNSEQVKLIMSRPVEGTGRPGVITRISREGISIGTRKGLLLITELQPSGKRPMSAYAFVQGRKISEGERVGQG